VSCGSAGAHCGRSFWITLGWLFLPGINVFLFILSLVLMIPAMINTRPLAHARPRCFPCRGLSFAEGSGGHLPLVCRKLGVP
jgi:hypothetical protein